MPDPDSKLLLQRLRRGDPDAFRCVYEEHSDAVYGFLLRLSKDPSVAADLFQNVWLKLARKAASLAEQSHLRGWLLTVARREYLSFRRAEALDLSRVLLLWPGVRESEGRAPVVAEVLALKKALCALSDDDRCALLLTAVQGLDGPEAAAVLGVSPVAFRQRLARARARLSQLLEANGPERDATRTRFGFRHG